MEFASSSSILTGSGGNFFIRFGGLLKLQMGKKEKKGSQLGKIIQSYGFRHQDLMDKLKTAPEL